MTLNKRRKYLNKWPGPIKSGQGLYGKDKNLNQLNLIEIALGGRIIVFKDEPETEYLAEDKTRYFKERK